MTSSAIASCPQSSRFAIEVIVVGMDDAPLASMALALKRPDGQASLTRTDTSGLTRFSGLEAAPYQLSLNELDEASWELVSAQAISANANDTSSSVQWAAAPQAASVALSHTIQQGEGTDKVADRYGFFADVLWEASENVALKAERGDMNILFPGDVLVIPAKRTRWMDVAVTNRYKLRRKGIPAMLRVRFLVGDTPRADLKYLMSTQVASGEPIADTEGATDGDGWLQEALPPSATKVTVMLATAPEPEEYEFDIGFINPLSTLSGVRARLKNLGYACGDEQGEDMGERTQVAIAAFQRDQNLTDSGEADSATRDALQHAFQS